MVSGYQAVASPPSPGRGDTAACGLLGRVEISVILASLAVHVFFRTRLTDSGIHSFSFVFTVPWTSQLFSVNTSCAKWYFGGG